MSASRVRQLYDRVEKAVAPITEQVVRADEIARAAALDAAVNKRLRAEAHRAAARAW